MNNIIMFTHCDLDGAGCRILFELAMAGNEDAIVLNCTNGNIDDVVRETMQDKGPEYEIWFSDIVASREILEELVKKHRVKIFDHHRSNLWAEAIVSEAHILPDTAVTGRLESGTSVFFMCSGLFDEEDFGGSLLSRFVDCVRSYDTYEWKTTGNVEAKMMNVLFQLLRMEAFCRIMKHQIFDDLTTGNFESQLFTSMQLEFIDAKIENEQHIIDDIIEKYSSSDDKGGLIDMQLGQYRAVLQVNEINASFSELAYQFLQIHPEVDVFVGFSMYGKGIISLRSRDDGVDVSAIASALGGGGHAQASGVSLPEGIRQNLIGAIREFLNGTHIGI